MVELPKYTMKENTMNINERIQYVGMDVHNDSIHLAVIRDGDNKIQSSLRKRNEWSVVKKYLLKI